MPGIQHTLRTQKKHGNSIQTKKTQLYTYSSKARRPTDDTMSLDRNTEASYQRASDRRLHSTTVDSTSVKVTTRRNRSNGLDHTRPVHNTTRSWPNTVSTVSSPETTRHDSNTTLTRQDPDTTQSSLSRSRHSRSSHSRSSHSAGLYKIYTKYLLRRIAKNALNYAIMATTTKLLKVTK